MPQHRQHCHCSVIVLAVVPAAATRRCHTSHRGTRRLGLSESDEQEAVNGRTGASVQLADSPPGPLALRVPDRLPVQQLIPETVGRERKSMCCRAAACTMRA